MRLNKSTNISQVIVPSSVQSQLNSNLNDSQLENQQDIVVVSDTSYKRNNLSVDFTRSTETQNFQLEQKNQQFFPLVSPLLDNKLKLRLPNMQVRRFKLIKSRNTKQQRGKDPSLDQLLLQTFSTRSQRTTTQGFGKKSEFYDKIIQRSFDMNPEPVIQCYHTYLKKNICKFYEEKHKNKEFNKTVLGGRFFGISRNYYNKTGILGCDFKNNFIDHSDPGVGSYTPDSPLTRKSINIKIHERIKLKTNVQTNLQIYYPVPIHSEKHKNISFGFSQRTFLTKMDNGVPGSNNYHIKRYLEK